ncbi:lipocalin-like domain-containing protein [Gemmatimonadota bacterium]
MPRGLRNLLFVLLLLCGLGRLGLPLADPEDPDLVRTRLSVSEILGGSPVDGFARALKPRPFAFPLDHGPHLDYRTEWWYLTGNLMGSNGELYGFQFTIFRSALDPEAPSGGSPWATNQVYMGHLALTDLGSRTFDAFERFSRGAQGLAGSQAEPFRVWLEDWVLEGRGDGLFPLRLAASEGDRGLSLVLTPEKPLVLQGDEGHSQKGPEAGNASFYYSYTRLATTGTVTVEGREVPVQGTAWFDREWSTSAISGNQVGWDWFALQLSDGRDLMYYQIRRADGSPDPLSKGVLVDGQGGVTNFGSELLELEVRESWESPEDGTLYPSRWCLAIPEEDIKLEVTPLIPNQELNLTFRYWEGAVAVRGTANGTSVEGRGYVELTGYADNQGRIGARPIRRGTSRL